MKSLKTCAFLIALLFPSIALSWYSKEFAQEIIRKFEVLEEQRSHISYRGTDRRSSAPFISGDSFRHVVDPQNICEDSNRCRMSPENVKNGSCVFVKTDMFNFFANELAQRIPGTYKLIVHNGDLSSPDGQSDAPRIGMPRYIGSDALEKEFKAGRLLAHHGQNLWWYNHTERPKPVYAHCLPIGIENRQYNIGKHLDLYIDAIRRNIVDKPKRTVDQLSRRPLLLIAFYPKSRVPDREKVLRTIGAIPKRGDPATPESWFNKTDLSHQEWLDAIGEHRFVLAPFGHGLDTHRISEILLMGGVPVTRRSTISSCYDDSDNEVNGTRRGSLPIVILDSWEDLTQQRLEGEWQRLGPLLIDTNRWDPSRLFIDHWLERIGCAQ